MIGTVEVKKKKIWIGKIEAKKKSLVKCIFVPSFLSNLATVPWRYQGTQSPSQHSTENP